MTYARSLVNVTWLNARLNLSGSEVIVLDASVHLADTGRNAREEYETEHIPGALFFDLEKIANPDNPRPRKIPSRELFVREVGKLGIGSGKHVVAYDTLGLYSAARIWWMFRHFGYDNVSVLDGGMVAWKRAGLPVEGGIVELPPTKFEPGKTRDLLALWPNVLESSQTGGQIIDARTPGRWAGTENDRYPGTRAGHIPNSLNLYWASLLKPETKEFLPVEEVKKKFVAAGVSMKNPATLSCGSGLTACILALALHRLGKEDWRVYDGSWDEWGRRPDLPIEVSKDK